jgi:predicted permease
MSAVASVMIASASAVAKVFVILGIGYVAAIRPRPIPLMPPNAINSISKMNLYLLVIPLIYSTIASSVTPEKLGSAWFVLLSAIGVICLSYGVASLLGRLPFFRVDNKTDFDALRISAAFPNILAL